MARYFIVPGTRRHIGLRGRPLGLKWEPGVGEVIFMILNLLGYERTTVELNIAWIYNFKDIVAALVASCGVWIG